MTARGPVVSQENFRKAVEMASINKTACRIVIDLISLALVSIPIVILYFVGQPFHRGFYCDDESIKYPYKSNTVPTSVASLVGVLVPISTILILESIRLSMSKRNFHNSLIRRKLVVSLYRTIGSFLFGMAVTQLSTDMAKYGIGRLRPHFISVCKPHITNCTVGGGYIEGDVCTGTDLAAIKEARLSFPSGHASITFYCMVFQAMYLQSRMGWRKCWLLRPFLQLIFLYMAYYTSISRISDYMHHWSDVLGGSLLGIVVAILVVYFISDIMAGTTCCQPRGEKGLPLYNSARQDEDRLSVKTSTDSQTSSSGEGHCTLPRN